MAASLVLHIGEDDFHRTDVLRSAGSYVEECDSNVATTAWFKAGHRADLVCITEGPLRPAEAPLAIVKYFSTAPIVLFRTSSHNYLQKFWDLDVPSLVPPEKWLAGIEDLLALTRTNIARSAVLCAQAQRLCEETGRVRAWSRRLREERLLEEKLIEERLRTLRGGPGSG